MSKSSGNVLDPYILLKHFSADAIRYFLMREASIGADGNFSHEGFINRVNTDLTNDWANLVSRTTGMIEKYFTNAFQGAALYTAKEKEIRGAMSSWKKRSWVTSTSTSSTAAWNASSVRQQPEPLHCRVPALEPGQGGGGRPRLAGVLKTLCRAILSVNALLSPILTETSAKVRAIFHCRRPGAGLEGAARGISPSAGEATVPARRLQGIFR